MTGKADWRAYAYYILIAVLSLCSLCFLPFLGSEIGVQFNWPTTTAGWFSWAIIKGLGAMVNTLMFHLFICQGRENVREDPRYKEALDLLGKYRPREYVPRSESKWKAETYGKKATTVFITTAAASIGLTLAILSFDSVVFLSYVFTVGLGAIFGFLQQKTTEEYYTSEFPAYAKMIKEQEEGKKENEQRISRIES